MKKVLVAFLLVCVISVFAQKEVPTIYQTAVFPENVLFSERIINGYTALPYQFPHQATVFSTNNNSTGGFCGGSIISTTWILTAAHCTRGFNWYIIGVGSINRLQQQQTSVSNTAIEHAQYNPGNLNNDVCLIRLSAPLMINTAVQTIRLPRRSEQGQLWVDAQATASGFGRTTNAGDISNSLMYTGIRIISNAECTSVYGPDLIISSVICGRGWNMASQSTCNGDSGGPLILNYGGSNVHIGVVSFVSSAGCDFGNPSGYMRTTSFLDWIQTNSGIQIMP